MQTNHSADTAMLDQLSNATHYVATLFVGRGEFARHETKELKDARVAGAAMAAHYKNGRKPMVYAQLPSGRQFLVPDTFN
jgi:hypothetical protein